MLLLSHVSLRWVRGPAEGVHRYAVTVAYSAPFLGLKRAKKNSSTTLALIATTHALCPALRYCACHDRGAETAADHGVVCGGAWLLAPDGGGRGRDTALGPVFKPLKVARRAG